MKEPVLGREVEVDVETVIVGAGFAGIAVGAMLKRAGFESFVILDEGDDVGGTWRVNRYPGCECDVPAPLYSYSFAANPSWSRLLAPRAEIHGYLRDCVRRLGLEDHLRLGARVSAARFDEEAGSWRVEVEGGAPVTARALALCVGAQWRPLWPDVEGFEAFEGRCFHSSAWDEAYDPAGETVALIGTGASAVQLLPELARRAQGVHLYQRTAPWILPRLRHHFGRRERRLFERFPATQRAFRTLIYWSFEGLGLCLARGAAAMKPFQAVARAHLRRQVGDADLRERLTPEYVIGCKRILYSNDYYPTLGRDDVELVTAPITRVTDRGIISADGAERPVDTIVCATGFRIAEPPDITIVGRGGRELRDGWAPAYRGVSVPGFPNLFLVPGPNSGLGHTSFVFMLESQARYVVEALRLLRRRELRWADVRPSAVAGWGARLRPKLDRAVWASGCRSYYFDADGENRVLWPGFSFSYRLATRRFRARDHELAAAPQAAQAGNGSSPACQGPDS